jgi:uncharacterized protein
MQPLARRSHYAPGEGKDAMLFLAAALALLVGLSLGLLGGGGSILTVPILRYVLGIEGHQAIALSLLVVGTTSLAAVVPHARRGHVRFRTGILFGSAGMAGAYLAGRVAPLVPAALLLSAFALMMFATAFAMLRSRPVVSATVAAEADGAAHELPVGKVLVEGVIVGAVTGFVGAGGGFLVVPALVLLGKLPMKLAVGTSLVVIAMKSLAGLAGFAGHIPIDWTLGLTLSGAAIAGSLLGSALVNRIRPAALRTGFGWFVVAMAFFILTQELMHFLSGQPSLVLSLTVAATGTLSLVLLRRHGARLCARRNRSTTAPPATNAPQIDVLVPVASKDRG